MNLQTIRLAELVPAPANPNRMTAEMKAALRANIKRRGFTQPILVGVRPDGRFDIADGHHRAEAMRDLGFTDIPAVVLQLTPDQLAALRLGMNRLRGDLDVTIAAEILGTLADAGFDAAMFSELGFTPHDVTAMLTTLGAETDALLGHAASLPAEPAVASKPFVLEIKFATKADMQKAQRGLKKAAGTTRDLGLGLLNVLGRK